MPGWSTDDLIPFMKKVAIFFYVVNVTRVCLLIFAEVETYHGDDPNNIHCTDGPIHVSTGTYTSTRSQNAFFEAGERQGWKEIPDLGDLETASGIQRAKRCVSPDGTRQDVAHQYLHPRLQDGKHPNLYVLVETQVVRVLFDGKKASGVTYQSSAAPDDDVRTSKGRKLVILYYACSGAARCWRRVPRSPCYGVYL
jgi:alcohol oxidase